MVTWGRCGEDGVLYTFQNANDDLAFVDTTGNGTVLIYLMQTRVSNRFVCEPFLFFENNPRIYNVGSFDEFAVLSGPNTVYTQLWVLPNHSVDNMGTFSMVDEAHKIINNIQYAYGTSSIL